jgi:hypothetical protein
MNKRLLVHESQLAGKTVRVSFSFFGRFHLIFDDGTMAILDYEPAIECVELTRDVRVMPLDVLVDERLATQQEVDAFVAEVKAKDEAQYLYGQRKKYERLKRLFGPD